MKTLLAALLFAAAAAGPARAAFEDEGFSEAAVSTDTAKNGEEEDGQTLIQENDEDLAAFITDYIRKDIQLKGAFLMEDKTTRKFLKLAPYSVSQKAEDGENGVKKVKAVLEDTAGRKYDAVFYLQSGPWGGLDIFKIDLKAAASKPAPAKKK